MWNFLCLTSVTVVPQIKSNVGSEAKSNDKQSIMTRLRHRVAQGIDCNPSQLNLDNLDVSGKTIDCIKMSHTLRSSTAALPVQLSLFSSEGERTPVRLV